MSEPARSRFALDLDDLERQLRGAAQPPKPGQSVDPLAELTRIVGQDDPLKDLFAGRARPAPAPSEPAWPSPARREPALEPAPAPEPARAVSGAPPAEVRGALDEFEALLRRTEDPRQEIAPAAFVPAKAEALASADDRDFDMPEPLPYSRPAPAGADFPAPRDLDQDGGNYPYVSRDEVPEAFIQSDMTADDYYEPEPEPKRSRKGLWTAAALLGIGVIGVGAAMTFRGSDTPADGQPPLISANSGPTKVQPANPGGAVIPDQNKQIYERAGETPVPATKVVSREEQPVDVQQAARTMAPRVVLPGPGSATPETATSTGAASNPLSQAPAAPERVVTAAEPALTPVPPVPGLGEPRRVRTVSIKPDGTPAPSASTSAAYVNGAVPPATGSTPTRVDAPGASPSVPFGAAPIANPPPRPRQAATPVTTPEAPKAQERIAAPAATTPSPPVRVANALPTQTAPAASAAPRAGAGDFVVQLAAPGSESEARATFAALQRKYPEQLGSQSPIVRKTELAGGKTVFRVRVGPYSRDDATTMCTALQAAGGQCFIAKN